jgi:hypothetical protein
MSRLSLTGVRYAPRSAMRRVTCRARRGRNASQWASSSSRDGGKSSISRSASSASSAHRNASFLLAIMPLIAALAARNRVMLKPSERTPRTAEFIGNLLADPFPTQRWRPFSATERSARRIGASGMGTYHGESGFRTFSHCKAVFLQSRLNLSRFLRPAFGRVTDGLCRLLMMR